MILNLDNPIDRKRFEARCAFLLQAKKKVELKEIRKFATLAQNRYAYLLFYWFGMETGYDKETVKNEFFKKTVNPEYFIAKTSGNLGDFQRLKSSTELDTKQMTECIERFRNWSSAVAGIYLPEPNETEFLEHIQNEINKYQNAIF